jgi:hypothetical protein
MTRHKLIDGLVFVLQVEKNSRFVLNAKNISGKNFILSENEGVFKENAPGYQGKVKSSFFGS